MKRTEREIVDSTPIADETGRLLPAAIGFARAPRVTTEHLGSWGRRKRWTFWCVYTPTHVLSLVVADLDYLGVAGITWLEVATNAIVGATAGRPFSAGVAVPTGLDGHSGFEGRNVRLHIEDNGAEIRIHGGSRRITLDVRITRPSDRDTLDVVVPWGDKTYQLTSKQPGLPARGEVTVDGVRTSLDGALATLDHGRGRWPWDTHWFWASAVDEKTGTALNLGGTWTDGTASTENGVWVGGRLQKLGGDVRFIVDDHKGWRMEGDGVDLRCETLARRDLGVSLWLLGGHFNWRFGRFHGNVAGVPFNGALGWAEEVRIRW